MKKVSIKVKKVHKRDLKSQLSYNFTDHGYLGVVIFQLDSSKRNQTLLKASQLSYNLGVVIFQNHKWVY